MDSDFYLKVEDYLSGEMSEKERISFESELKNNSEAAAEFDMFQKVSKSLTFQLQSEDKQTELKNTLTQISPDFFKESASPEPKIIPFYQKHWKIIASVAAAFVMIFAVILLMPSKSLYEQYAIHEPAGFTEKGGNEMLISEAENAFNSKKYEAALDNLNQILTGEPANSELIFYKGICLLELNQTAEARLIFQNLSDGNSILKNEAQWYLALTFLKENDFENCKNALNQIPSTSTLRKKAQSLLKKLP